MQEIYFRRLLEIYPSMDIRAFDLAAAQGYISRRSRMLYRGRSIQRETIEKELKTLRQVWAWVAGRSTELPQPSFTLKALSLPKSQAKLPFMSWSQIEREVARGGLSGTETAALWDCFWLGPVDVGLRP